LDAPLRSETERSTLVEQLASVGRRLASAVWDEVSFDPRKTLAYGISRGLPQFRFCRTRTALLRVLGLRIGRDSGVLGPIDVTGPGDVTRLLRIGELTYISGPLHIDLGAEVHIGNGVRFGHDVMLLTFDHDIGPSEYRCGRLVAAPIRIGNGVWIGSRATILPGVSIGDGAVVGTGALVTRDVPPNTLVAGVPARNLRDLDETVGPPSFRRDRTVPALVARVRG
jgi:maltose O-acetyltransferase